MVGQLRGPGGWRRWLAWLACWPLLALAAGPLDGQFQIHSAYVVLEHDVLRLNAHIQYPDNERILNALHDGATLSFHVAVTITRPRRLWFSATVLDTDLKRELRYHAATGRFLVQGERGAEQGNYATLEEALDSLGHLADVPILTSAQLSGDGPFTVAVRAEVRRGHLPAALRAVAFWSDDWDRSSDWYSWTLLP